MKANCTGHKNAKLVFETPIPVYAGAGMDKTIPPTGATVIDLAGMLRPTVQTFGFDVPGLSGGRYMRIEWQDRGVPDLSLADWQAIAAALVAHGGPVMVACAGGHGRTGTALAVLGHVLGAFPDADTDPIAHVRKVYCPETVESSKQVSYVKALTGRATKCKPSDDEAPKKLAWSTGGGTLCPERVGGKFCNLDNKHTGPHDTRPRAEIDLDSLAPLSTSASTSNVRPLKANKGPILFCPIPKCMLKVHHAGAHLGVGGQEVTD